MKYCRLAIETPAHGRVYSKDFDAANVFGPLVQILAGELLREEIIADGDLYRAVITPRYENSLLDAAIVRTDTDRAVLSHENWLAVEWRDGIARSGEPLTFFTVELRFPESGTIISRDMGIERLDTIWQNLQTALLRMHVLHAGDEYMPQVAICEDEQADFFGEQVVFPDSGDEPLIELIDEDAPETAFPLKSLADFGALTVVESGPVHPSHADATPAPPTDETVQIVLAGRTLDALEHIAQADVVIEQGGMLVGHVYQNATVAGGYLVEITDHLPAEGTEASLVELRYTFESWQRQTVLLHECYPGKQIVGWYHTHLVETALPPRPDVQADTGELQTTELFFSQDDHFLHRRFFPDRWYVALVLGSRGGAVFFRWVGDQIGPNRRFYVVPERASDANHESR